MNHHYPKGWQVVLTRHAGQILGVVHCFGDPLPERVEVGLPWGGRWRLGKIMAESDDGHEFEIVSGSQIRFQTQIFSGAVFVLEEDGAKFQ